MSTPRPVLVRWKVEYEDGTGPSGHEELNQAGGLTVHQARRTLAYTLMNYFPEWRRVSVDDWTPPVDF